MALMGDSAVLGFLATQAKGARYVTSVCTGSLVLGAAGLLGGYDAATHWAFMDVLPMFGARPVRKRVVVDRTRITGGGVTAGIDFGLTLAAELAGEAIAKGIQLGLEYDPAPPFGCGHPDIAEPDVVATVRAHFDEAYRKRMGQSASFATASAAGPSSGDGSDARRGGTPGSALS
jgi:cyclohexyl-isocyanide hydratase